MGWVGTIFLLAGMVLVAYQKRFGFILGIIGNSLWCVKGLNTGQNDLVVVEIIVTGIAAFSWYNWRRINVGSTNDIHSGSTSE